YANDPLAPAAANDFAREVEAYIEEVALRFAMPDEVVAVVALPRTAAGRLDRAALPQRQARPRGSAGHDEPMGPMEEALAALWREVLGVEDVGRHDSFFDLGGDSMRGIQVVAQANRIGLDFALRDLIEHQTIAQLAVAVDRPMR